MKRPFAIYLLTCLCAAVALIPGFAFALMPTCRLTNAVCITAADQNVMCSVSSPDGKGVAVTGKTNLEETGDIQARVEKFVHRRYNGVPYLKSKELGTEAVPILQAMLRDTSETANWSTIIMAMGFIGDSSSVRPLIDFLENRFEGDVNIKQLRALLSVIDALGFIANKGSLYALEYLSKACYVKTWMAKDLKWHFGNYSGERLAILLAQFGVTGLSYSGTDKGREILLSLQKHPESAKSGTELKSDIKEGLERIDRIQREGVARVFGAQ